MSRYLAQPVLRLVFISLILAGGLTACGQKGPLYLPQSDNTSTTTESQP